jgi:FMN phosphatase YigB (HAD superfamily)
MSKKPAIVFDIDQVVLDWFGGFAQWMYEEKGFIPQASTRDEKDYAMTTVFPTLGREKINPFIHEFNQTHAYGALPFNDGVLEAIKGIRAEFGETHGLIAISSCGVHPRTVFLRSCNLSAVDLDELHILPLMASKRELLATYPKGTVMFEDSPKHAEEIVAAGHEVIIYDQGYNSGLSYPRIYHWDEALPKLRELMKVTA